jgi:hypothetical protein
LITGRVYKADKIILPAVLRTQTWLERARGLLGRGEHVASKGLIIAPCNSVHSFFMGYRLDLVYLDANFTIIKICHSLKIWRFSSAWGAKMVLELKAGQAESFDLKVGEQLKWQGSF